MKTLQKLKFTVVAMVTVSFLACTEKHSDIAVLEAEAEKIENPEYEIIRSLGFSTENIVETNDYYIVEGDIVLDKVAMFDDVPKTRQAKYKYTVLPDVVQNISVYINPEIGPSWSQAVVEALNEWSNIPNCFIGFTSTTLPTGYHVEVSRDQAAVGSAIAVGAYPQSNNCPGSYVKIGSEGYKYDTWPDSFKKYVMVHEFGHILGFVHTDWRDDQPDSHSGALIAGTPDGNDNMSVMNHEAQYYWSGFSQGDLAAAQVMYGPREITGPLTAWASVPTTYTLDFATNLTRRSVEWYVNDVLRQAGPSINFTLVSPPQATLTLRAVVNCDGGSYEAARRISVADFTINGPGSTTLNTDVTYTVVPDVLPAGVTFTGWTVSPNTYTTTSGLKNRSLKVKFTGTTASVYNITANFRLPNGSNYTTSKGVTVAPPPPPPAPEISVSGYLLDDREASALGKGGQKVYWVQPYGSFLTVSVSNYVSYAAYEWRASYTSPYSATGSYINITLPSYTMLFPVECRASSTSGSTGWSTVWIYSSTTAPSENPYQYLRAVEEAKSKYGDSALL